MLEGRNTNLRVMEKDDVDFLVECINNIDFYSEYGRITRLSKEKVTKGFEKPTQLAILTANSPFLCLYTVRLISLAEAGDADKCA